MLQDPIPPPVVTTEVLIANLNHEELASLDVQRRTLLNPHSYLFKVTLTGVNMSVPFYFRNKLRLYSV
jgi:hypothetical protein